MVLMVAACLLLLFFHVLTRNVPDLVLDAHSLALQQSLSFNPRSISYCVYLYIRLTGRSKRPAHSDNDAIAQIGNANGIYFHWDDWTDLLPANGILDRYRTLYPDGKCDASLKEHSSVNPYFMELYNTKVSRAMTNLYCSKDIPKRVLAATDAGFIQIPVLGKRRVLQSMPKRVTKLTVIQEMEACNKEAGLSVIPYQLLRKTVSVSPQDFVFDPNAEIFSLKERLNNNDISADDLKHLQFLEAANVGVEHADRFFKYPWIYTDIVAGRSHHISFPFFRRYVSNRERQSVLHHMVRVWFRFAEANGIDSWLNYGLLLGWAYNGVNMPWDTDIDIQLPIAQLDRLSRRFNSTLIMENPRDGNAKYLFEVSPTYIRQGNGRNFIDARFIDINTGLYIDISALSHTADPAPEGFYGNDALKLRGMPVHCKNWNWHSLDELLPIRHTYFEGASVYVPRNVSSILLRKYGDDSFTSKHRFNSHNYRTDLLLWVPDRECVGHPQSPARTLSKQGLRKCLNLWLDDEFRIVSQAAQRHKELNVSPDESVGYEIASLGDLPVFRKDSWDYYNEINNKMVTTSDWSLT